MSTEGTKSHAIEEVRRTKASHPHWHPRLARFRPYWGKRRWWWYCWTVMERRDPMEREHELLRHIFGEV